MTFLLDAVVDLVVRTGIWLAFEVAIAAAAAGAAWWIASLFGVRLPWRTVGIAAVLGVLAAASLAHRFDLPDPGHVEVWRRPVYLLWSGLGACLGAGAGALASLRSARESAAS